MEVILLKDVTDLGKQGDVVSVKRRYARGYLLPEGAAIAAATPKHAVVEKTVRDSKVQIQGSNGLRSVLERLRLACEEVAAGYSDVARRELTWQTLQTLVNGSLWAAVEHLEGDPYRQQLADVLDAAVGKLEAFQLEEKHFSAIDSTLSRLAATAVTEDDVDACEQEWQAVDVSTLPALRASFEEWLAASYSGVEDGG